MTVDCYEFYQWSVGELALTGEVTSELTSQIKRKERPHRPQGGSMRKSTYRAIFAALLTFITMAVSGCAFNGKDAPDGAPGTTGSELSSPSGMYLTASWSTEGAASSYSVKRALLPGSIRGEFFVKQPISLPAIVPDNFELKISPTTADTALGAPSASFAALPEGEEREPLALRSTVEQGNRFLEVRIAGLRAVLPDDSRKKLYSELKISDLEQPERKLKIRFTLETPPIAQEIFAIPISDVSENLHTLASDSMKLHLFAAFRIANDTKTRVEVQLPRELDGELRQKLTKFTVAIHNCGYNASQRTVVHSEEVRAFVLPIVSDLARKWPRYLSEEEDYRRVLEAGDFARFAIYAQGENADRLVEFGPRRYSTYNVEAIQCVEREECHYARGRESCRTVTDRHRVSVREGLQGGPVYFGVTGNTIPLRLRHAHSHEVDDPSYRNIDQAMPEVHLYN